MSAEKPAWCISAGTALRRTSSESPPERKPATQLSEAAAAGSSVRLTAKTRSCSLRAITLLSFLVRAAANVNLPISADFSQQGSFRRCMIPIPENEINRLNLINKQEQSLKFILLVVYYLLYEIYFITIGKIL